MMQLGTMGLTAGLGLRLLLSTIRTTSALVLFGLTGNPAGLLSDFEDTVVVQAVPPDFEDVTIATVSNPMDIAFTPDGRILVPDKLGRLWVIEDDAVLPTPAIDLSAVMCTNGERALGGVEVHPNFDSNHYVYLYYTYNKFGTCNESEVDGPVNRLSQFVLPDSNIIDPATEEVLFDTPPLFRDHHNGGDIEFGKDGLLYVTVGDGGTRRFGWPQDPGRLLGKIVRLTDDGGIPPGNPYTGAGTARCNLDGVPPAGSPDGTKCQEVFSQGLRNPFRFAFDPNDPGVRFYINDVGQSSWEEISEGPIPGADYGWGEREGPCEFDSTTVCGPSPAGMTDPIHWYGHGPDGAAITGGAFVPNGIWPAQYDGLYLYADYVFGTIYELTPGGTECLTCIPPTSAYNPTTFSNTAQVVTMKFGPYGATQALYYVDRFTDAVHRIAYVGSANRAPTAVATATPTAGPLPLDVQFDGTGSSDPDGDPLTYAWDFEGDSIIDSTDPAPLHTYATAGTFFATLTVDDGNGGQNTTTIRIDPGNSPPVPTIDTPADGTTFAVGDVFTLVGQAVDPEDGALADADLTWEVRQHHATHYHPFLDPTIGNNIVLQPAPEPEDLLAATNSHLEVLLTATDSGGVSTTVSRLVMPKTVDLTFDTVPQGLDLILDGSTITAPQTVVSWGNHGLRVEAPDQTDANNRSWGWVSWSDGGAQAHTITVPATPASYSATFVETTPTVFTFTATDDATIRESRPTRTYGGRPDLEVDASSRKDILLRFDVSGVGSSSPASVTLRLFAIDPSSTGGDFWIVTDSGWSEGTVTWDNAPAGDGGFLGALGSVAAGNWYELDVTPLVTADGPVSIRVTSDNSNGADYASTEHSNGNAPELIVEAGDPPVQDTEPPSAPGNLRATDVQATVVTLAWDASTDNVGVTAYDIYRDGALLDSVGGATTSYVDGTVAPLSSYQYEVQARDAAGNVSAPSNTLNVTTPDVQDTEPPSAPGNLRTTDVQANQVTLAWDASTDNVGVTGYDIYRNGALLDSVGGATTSYVDGTVAPETPYQYEVRAQDAAGNVSAPSNMLNVTTPAAPALAFDVTRNGSVYDAVSQTTPSSYSGTLKFVVESALDELRVAGGGSILFAAGDFDLGSDHFEIDDLNDVTFAGQGMGVTTIRNFTNASSDTEPFDVVRSDRLIVRDLTVAAGGSDRSTSDALDFDGGDDILIERVEVTDSRGRGIIFDGKDDPAVTGGTADRNVVRDCIITNVPRDGIQLLAANNNTIENCHISNTGAEGIRVHLSSSSSAQPNKPSNDNSITGNLIENAVGNGITVTSGNRNLIQGNTVINNGIDGIKIFTSTSSLNCDDNVVDVNTASGNRYGLNIESSNCNRTVVSDNDFSGNSTAPINDNGTDTIYTSSDTEPPTAPGNLVATDVQATQVTLGWDASTDNIAVTAYDVYRDGSLIATVGGATLGYLDGTVAPLSSYQYEVRARDAAGNVSAPSNTLDVTTPAGPPVMTFTPTDDATVRESRPTRNYGGRTKLEVDADSRKDILIRFDVSGVGSSSATNVTLRLFNLERSSVGGDFWIVTDSAWSEDSVTWDNAPAGDGGFLGSLGSVSAGNWYEIDVTSLVTGDGPVSLRITSDDRNGADYASKEHTNGNAPELVVTTGP